MADTLRTTVAASVTMLAEAFNRQVSKPMVEAYRIGLAGLTAEQVQAAAATALRSSKFMPSPAELRELAGELRWSDRAERAWMAFSSAVTKYGGNFSISFDDTVINATANSLGDWPALCAMETKEFDTFLRARFLKAYESLARAGVRGDVCRPLVGLFERENAINGYGPDSERVKQLENCNTGQLVAIETGLPLLPNAPRLTHSNDQAASSVPRLIFKKP